MFKVKKGIFILFALFVWLTGTNHCAFEQFFGNFHEAECPCGAESSDQSQHHCYTGSCLTSKVVLSQQAYQSPDVFHLHAVFTKIFRVLDTYSISQSFSLILEIIYLNIPKLVNLLVMAPNAPPLAF